MATPKTRRDSLTQRETASLEAIVFKRDGAILDARLPLHCPFDSLFEFIADPEVDSDPLPNSLVLVKHPKAITFRWTWSYIPGICEQPESKNRTVAEKVKAAMEQLPSREECWRPAVVRRSIEWLSANLVEFDLVERARGRGQHCTEDPVVWAASVAIDFQAAMEFLRRAERRKALVVRNPFG